MTPDTSQPDAYEVPVTRGELQEAAEHIMETHPVDDASYIAGLVLGYFQQLDDAAGRDTAGGGTRA